MYRFYSSCVEYPNLEDLNTIIENERTITLNTFKKHVDREQFNGLKAGLGYTRDFKLEDDWHVSYHKSKDKRKNTVYYMQHSAIEYIFKEEN
jgi:hypothetical protein